MGGAWAGRRKFTGLRTNLRPDGSGVIASWSGMIAHGLRCPLWQLQGAGVDEAAGPRGPPTRRGEEAAGLRSSSGQ